MTGRLGNWKKHTFAESKPSPECWIISSIAKSKKQIGLLKAAIFYTAGFNNNRG